MIFLFVDLILEMSPVHRQQHSFSTHELIMIDKRFDKRWKRRRLVIQIVIKTKCITDHRAVIDTGTNVNTSTNWTEEKYSLFRVNIIFCKWYCLNRNISSNNLFAWFATWSPCGNKSIILDYDLITHNKSITDEFVLWSVLTHVLTHVRQQFSIE